MELFPYELEQQLNANGHRYEVEGIDDLDLWPVVRIFGGKGCVWLLTRSRLHQPDHLYGLCDLGADLPEAGYVSREWMENAELETPYGDRQPLQRDEDFQAAFPLSVYKAASEHAKRIVANNIEYLEKVEEYTHSLASA